MRALRDLTLKGAEEELDQVVEKIESLLTDGWTRDRELERKVPNKVVFRCTESEQRRGAAVWLSSSAKGTRNVSNVTPSKETGRHSLSDQEYNEIVSEFYDRFVVPATAGTSVEPVLGKAARQLEDYLSPGTADLLRDFSDNANPSTGASHPSDEIRWHEFVIAAHREGAELSASTLRIWLMEHGEWDQEGADDLAVLYDYERDLLKQYDNSWPQTSN